MATKNEIMNKINTIIDDNAKALKDYNRAATSETKAALEEKLNDIENCIFQIEAGGSTKADKVPTPKEGGKKPKTNKEKNTMAKAKKAKKVESKEVEPTEEAVIDKNVTAKQYDLLLILETKSTPVDDLKESYKDGKIPHLMLNQLEKKGLCQVTKVETNGAMVKKAVITHAGEEVRDTDWVKPVKKESSKPAKKKKFVPPHSEDDLAGLKKKKRKKAIKENEAARIAFDEKASKPNVRTPSIYVAGTIPKGKHQKDSFMDTPNEANAVWDLWEEFVTLKFKHTRSEFIKEAESKGIKGSTAASQWSKIYTHYGLTKEDVANIASGKKVVTDEAPKKKAKKAKKGKKGKKTNK